MYKYINIISIKKPLITGELAPSWVDLPLLPSEPGGFIINCRRAPL